MWGYFDKHYVEKKEEEVQHKNPEEKKEFIQKNYEEIYCQLVKDITSTAVENYGKQAAML